MKIQDTITQPEKIIPLHLQHNAKGWNKHHMAGMRYKKGSRNKIKYTGVGKGINLPIIKDLDNNFKKKRVKVRNQWNVIDKKRQDALYSIFDGLLS